MSNIREVPPPIDHPPRDEKKELVHPEKEKCEGCGQRYLDHENFIKMAHAVVDQFDAQYKFFAAHAQLPQSLTDRIHEGERWQAFLAFVTGEGFMNGTDHTEWMRHQINHSIQMSKVNAYNQALTDIIGDNRNREVKEEPAH